MRKRIIQALPNQSSTPNTTAQIPTPQEEANEAAFFGELRTVIDELYDHQEMVEIMGGYPIEEPKSMKELYVKLRQWRPELKPAAWRRFMAEQRETHSEECADVLKTISKKVAALMKQDRAAA